MVIGRAGHIHSAAGTKRCRELSSGGQARTTPADQVSGSGRPASIPTPAGSSENLTHTRAPSTARAPSEPLGFRGDTGIHPRSGRMGIGGIPPRQAQAQAAGANSHNPPVPPQGECRGNSGAGRGAGRVIPTAPVGKVTPFVVVGQQVPPPNLRLERTAPSALPLSRYPLASRSGSLMWRRLQTRTEV